MLFLIPRFSISFRRSISGLQAGGPYGTLATALETFCHYKYNAIGFHTRSLTGIGGAFHTWARLYIVSSNACQSMDDQRSGKGSDTRPTRASGRIHIQSACEGGNVSRRKAACCKQESQQPLQDATETALGNTGAG
ncbi:uncharacterized [Tachysurus ichikawai]